VAGILLGLASGTLFFAIFLIPLWAVFYGRRGGDSVYCFSDSGGSAAGGHADADFAGMHPSFVEKLIRSTNWTVYRLFFAAGSAAQESQLGQTYRSDSDGGRISS
jgi:hypothetical protein